MPLPIVLVHRGNSDYLLFSLAQARKMNPRSDIYLLGDNTNNHYKFVCHYNINNYFYDAEKFSAIYQHFNTNNYNYELFCFQRWFILRNFLEQNKLNRCFYMDSDVMLYTDISVEQKQFEQFDLTLSYPPTFDSPSPHCMFINKFEALTNFCNFISEIYSNESLINIMKLQLQKYVDKGGGGACDMTAFREYQKTSYSNIGNTAIIGDNFLYDHNINESNGFEMRNGIKNIYWIDGKPFARLIDSPTKIQVKLLHCQGSAKAFMKNYCTDTGALAKYYFNLSIKKATNFYKMMKI